MEEGNKLLTVQLPVKQHKKLKDAAQRSGDSMATLVREAIAQYLTSSPTLSRA